MQPNDQNQQPLALQPTQNGYVSPSGADVPEYLHMDPIVEKPKRSKKKLFMGIGAILALLLIGGGGYGYWWWVKTEPERKFYQALEYSMTAKYAERGYIATSKDSATKIDISVRSDFSNVYSPASSLSYSLALSGATLSADIVTSKSMGTFGRLIQRPDDRLNKNVQNDQWYNLSAGGSTVFDPLGLAAALNSPAGIVPTGGFVKQKRDQILSDIKEKQVYRIQSHKQEKGYTTYEVQFNKQELGKVLQGIAAAYGVKNSATLTVDNVDGQGVFIVNDKTNHFSRISYVTKVGEQPSLTWNLTINYPESLTVNEPENVKMSVMNSGT